MFAKSVNSGSVFVATIIAVSAVFLGLRTSYAESVDLYISDIDSRSVTVTAYDLNDGNKKIVNDHVLKPCQVT